MSLFFNIKAIASRKFTGGEKIYVNCGELSCQLKEIYIKNAFRENAVLVWQYDITPPTLTVITPSSVNESAPTATFDSSYKVSGTAEDSESGIKCVLVNGKEATISGKDWYIYIEPQTTTQAIEVVAIDNANNKTTKTLYLKKVIRDASRFRTIEEVGRDYGWYWTAGYSHWNVRTDTYGDGFNYHETHTPREIHSVSSSVWRQIEPRWSKVTFSNPNNDHYLGRGKAYIFRGDGTVVWSGYSGTIDLVANGWNDGTYWANATAAAISYDGGIIYCSHDITFS